MSVWICVSWVKKKSLQSKATKCHKLKWRIRYQVKPMPKSIIETGSKDEPPWRVVMRIIKTILNNKKALYCAEIVKSILSLFHSINPFCSRHYSSFWGTVANTLKKKHTFWKFWFQIEVVSRYRHPSMNTPESIRVTGAVMKLNRPEWVHSPPQACETATVSNGDGCLCVQGSQNLLV